MILRGYPLKKRVLLLACMITLTGCGYKWGYALRGLPGGYDQVAIPVFHNKTQFVGIEPYFTNALIEEFERSKIARVVSKGVAPAILTGTIKSALVTRGSLVKGTSEGPTDSAGEINFLPKNTALASSYRIVLTSHLVLTRTSDNKVLWQGNFANEIVYSAPRIGKPTLNSANANYNDSVRENKIAELAETMMEEAHDRVTENF